MIAQRALLGSSGTSELAKNSAKISFGAGFLAEQARSVPYESDVEASTKLMCAGQTAVLRASGPMGSPCTHEMSSQQFEILGQDQALLRAKYQNFYVMVWYGEVSLERLKLIKQEIARLIERFPKGVGVVSVLDKDAQPPDKHLRQVVAQDQDELAPGMKALTVVVDGMGFWASSLIIIATSILQSRKSRIRQNALRTFNAAATWILAEVPPSEPTSTTGFARVLEALRDEARERRSPPMTATG